MTAKTEQIRIEEFNYPLPDERIAKFPLTKRDESKLLVYRNGKIDEAVFKQLSDYLPQGSMLVYNNTRVIQARMLFQKETGSSPINYFIRLKIQKACQYIELTNLKLNEIALRLGFEEPAYFSRLFTKVMGISPSAYRAKESEHSASQSE